MLSPYQQGNLIKHSNQFSIRMLLSFMVRHGLQVAGYQPGIAQVGSSIYVSQSRTTTWLYD